jgi:hypothetical protein
VLIDAPGRIDDCVHDERVDAEHAPLVASLAAEGYQLASVELDHARAIVARAARLTSDVLPAAYYLGRDLLELGDAHLPCSQATTSPLAHAIELLAEGEPARALLALARCEASSPDVAAATAACLLALARPAEAIPHLVRAIEAEPEWPLHHWNLATACHRLGDPRGAYHALRRFVVTSAEPTGLYADPDQPGRVSLALRLIAELERTARLTGTSLRRRRSRRARS